MSSMKDREPVFEEFSAIRAVLTFPLFRMLMSQSESVTPCLSIVQEPVCGRMSGYTSAGTRPLDPILIVKVDFTEPVADYYNYILILRLYTESGIPIEEAEPVQKRRKTRIFMKGNTVACCQSLHNEFNEYGYYFVFQDLGISTTGRFRLYCQLYHIGHSKPVCDTLSSPFEIFSAGKYPGLRNSGPLMKAFKDQGVQCQYHQLL
ncbi:velvet factor-domain-containing protein [Gorgonomyces haynaldii]|nr:velvet factor-domain-containing protein [Gorgonomyces haynaldii]